jgi:hypothetical protein
MRSEMRVGRLRGSGASISLTTGYQVVGGLSVTLDIPRGCVALVTLHAQFGVVGNTAVATLEVDGTGLLPSLGISTNGYAIASEAFLLTSGKRALRVLVNASSAASSCDPTSTTLSWVIAPLGGAA